MTSYLITGATGRLGGSALDALLALIRADDIHVLVRSSADSERLTALGVTAHLGSYADPASLRAAFTGVDRLLFVSSPALDPAVRTTQHRNVVAAAIESGVAHLVYTSAMGADHDPGHGSTESALAESGMGRTILRNALYTEPFVAQALTDAAGGVVRSASGPERLATASIADLAEAAVRALIDPPAPAVWELRGPAWSFPELAEALTRQLGRPIAPRQVDDAEAGAFAPLFPLVRRGAFATETDDLAALLGRPPRGIAEVVAEMVAEVIAERPHP